MVSEKIIEIEWPKVGVKVEAKALPYNQKVYDAFCSSLPFETVQLHAMVTGKLLYSYSPTSIIEHMDKIEKRIKITEEPVGMVAWSGLGLITNVYGTVTEPLKTQPIAQIPEEFHEDLIKAGRAVWDAIFYTKELVVVQYRLKGGN